MNHVVRILRILSHEFGEGERLARWTWTLMVFSGALTSNFSVRFDCSLSRLHEAYVRISCPVRILTPVYIY